MGIEDNVKGLARDMICDRFVDNRLQPSELGVFFKQDGFGVQITTA